MIKRDIIVGLIFLVVGGTAGFVYAAEKKIEVCHATHSKTNPYVRISVAVRALDVLDHAGDFIPEPDTEDCTPAPTPTPTPVPPPPTGGTI